MKTFFRSAALALTVFTLGLAVQQKSVAAPTTISMNCPVPTCPPDDPNGCGIMQGTGR